MTRAQKAGEGVGKAIIEMVHLMCQNDTALHFLRYLMSTLAVEVEKRSKREYD